MTRVAIFDLPQPERSLKMRKSGRNARPTAVSQVQLSRNPRLTSRVTYNAESHCTNTAVKGQAVKVTAAGGGSSNTPIRTHYTRIHSVFSFGHVGRHDEPTFFVMCSRPCSNYSRSRTDGSYLHTLRTECTPMGESARSREKRVSNFSLET